MWRAYKSDNDIADVAGLDPDKQQLLCQLKAGERVLMKVQQERNKLQDAHTQLGEEIKRCSGPAVWLREGESAASSRHLQ